MKKKLFIFILTLFSIEANAGWVPQFYTTEENGITYEEAMSIANIIVKNKNKMKSFVEEHNLKDVVFFEGQQNNPYRFMCHANYLFLPSYHEAAPMVFNEANVLGLGVLATETLSAKELVEERKMGVVCENSVSGIYNMLHDTLKKGVIPPSTIIDKGYNEIVASQFEKMVNV